MEDIPYGKSVSFIKDLEVLVGDIVGFQFSKDILYYEIEISDGTTLSVDSNFVEFLEKK